MSLPTTTATEGTSSLDLGKSQQRNKTARNAIRVLGAVTALGTLSGCLLTSPYWNQEYPSHTAKIPLQTWTIDKTKKVKFECAKAAHFGLYPSTAGASWVVVAKVKPQKQPALDPLGGKIFGARKKTALPASCWRQDPANSVWYSAVRATQGSGTKKVVYQVFDKAGLECLNTWQGSSAVRGSRINHGVETGGSLFTDFPTEVGGFNR
ncbi:MAG: hypothetical protein GWP20_00800, partial [Thermotogales bacterium]|nr:hypothetical protein [Thermotogales bacterium]